MSFDRGTVDQNLRRRSAGLRERLEDANPNALFRPSDKTIVERLPRPIVRWRVHPSASRFQHMHDAADHPPVVDALLAARIGRQVRRDLRKLFLSQPEPTLIHRRFLSDAVNHRPANKPTTLFVRPPCAHTTMSSMNLEVDRLDGK